MHENASHAALTATDHIHGAILVKILEYRMFHGPDSTDAHTWPRAPNSVVARMKMDADLACFLPRGNEVHESVAVYIAGANAVGSLGRTIDRMARPWQDQPGGEFN